MKDELAKTRSYALRMREALMDRDRRLLGLENDLLRESAMRRQRDTECAHLMGKLKGAEDEIKSLRQKSQLANALQMGGTGARDLIARHPDVLQREGLRAARIEVVKLEKERDELAFMNGRLVLRLNDMRQGIDRLRKALKVEDAASRLNEAYAMSRNAQELVGDTARLLITDGTLDTPYENTKNPLSIY